MSVTIKPMPRSYLKIKEIFRPGHPPIFDVDPTSEDKLLAGELFKELDQDSQAWYGRNGIFADC